tara:strand:+ start:1153 stop:1434 length:282 start_codon:yes stop_codon:yes gene_type:complete
MLMADEAFDPVVSTFSKVGRVPFCDSGRMPSSYGARPACTSGRFAKGFLIGIVRMWSDAPEIISIDVDSENCVCIARSRSGINRQEKPRVLEY